MPKTIAVEGEEIKISDIQVIPVGEIVGIKLYTSGILVVGTSAIQGTDGTMHKPFENAEIEEGDSIIAINDKIVNNTNELINAINMSNGRKIKITYKNKKVEKDCEITPVKSKNNEYKIGLWVRDSAAGVGTVTFYNEQTQTFAALGHAITDIDTGDIIQTSSGEIDNVSIVSIVAAIALVIVGISHVPATAISYGEKVTEAYSAIKVQEKRRATVCRTTRPSPSVSRARP